MRHLAKDLGQNTSCLQAYADQLRTLSVALHSEAANTQHYEPPPEFFVKCLGKRRKYSCCEFQASDDLNAAEDRALATVCRRTEIKDGLDILDFGCGWGRFTSYAAERFPGASIIALSNSPAQGRFIRALGYENMMVQTAGANDFDTKQKFDRIVSIESLEHMRN